MLTEALRCAQHAVKLDAIEADLPVAILAYDEAIAILQRVITRRSQRPGITSEVQRVTDIVSQLVQPSKLALNDYCSPRRRFSFLFSFFVCIA
jgi:hypothetical protein